MCCGQTHRANSQGSLRQVLCYVQSIDNSLRSLGVDALDLVQFYWHDYGTQKYVSAAQRLAELQEAGKIRHIGVTNFDVPRLDEIVQGGVRVVSNQASCSSQCSQKCVDASCS